MNYELYPIGLMQYEIEEIKAALTLSAHICQNFEQNTSRYERIRSMANRFAVVLNDIEEENKHGN